VIATPLDARGLKLAQLPPQERLNELSSISTQRVHITEYFTGAGGRSAAAAARGRHLPGMVTGIIDWC
jgi:hypothetical protein